MLGIDPGFDRMGWAILEKKLGKEKLISSGCLITKRSLLYGERIFGLGQELEKIIKCFKPDIVAIEQLFFFKNQKTALKVSEARGMVLYIVASKNISVYELTPLQIKMALTGYGRAEKQQVQKMVMNILKLKKKPKYDDEIDAIACAMSCPAKL
ncbi:crossover junction endodeoxyribonuclease RuvC [Patescibacteria group bacterium]|nr:crossover junction endodeoxyribonuclease RuvC [Patescibacteria group bacterium]